MEEKKELLLFQLGPVQEFIAQAAEVSDLWAGSYLLSSLVWAGLREVPDAENAVVFPNLQDGRVRDALESELIPTIPNRFLAWVPAGCGADVAERVKTAIREKLNDYVQRTQLPAGAQTQVDQFLQMTWAVLVVDGNSAMGELYRAIGRKLSLRRNLRDFAPWSEDPAARSVDEGRKDFLSGKETALDKKSGRGALNLMKLRLPKLLKKRISGELDVPDRYIAVIALDGDRMGQNLSQFRDEAQHRAFSAALADFAGSVGGIVRGFKGELIYAGGDDVLAVVPATEAIGCARALRERFGDVRGADGQPLTASAGVAVGHRSVPLQELVHKAHAAESRAKQDYGRDALAMSVFKRSGETLEWGCKWTSKSFALYNGLRATMKDGFASRFPYKLASLLQPYELEKLGQMARVQMGEVVKLELSHAWSRSTGSGDVPDELKAAMDAYLNETFGDEGKPKDFLDLFLCETFIDRPREGGDND